MKDKLIIFKLSVKSSYIQNQEFKADEKFDTLQFYVHLGSIWRIKTYALDHDIHIYKVNPGNKSLDETVSFLVSSSNTHYGDIVDKMFEFSLDGPYDDKSAKIFFSKNKLNLNLESSPDFAFWNPDNAKYKTQSKPL